MIYPTVLTEARTLAAAASGRSLARFGDGELKLMLGRNACAQAADVRLAQLLKRVLMVTDGACLPCIPNIGNIGAQAASGNASGSAVKNGAPSDSAVKNGAQVAGHMAGDSAKENVTPKAPFWAQYRDVRYARLYTALGPYGSSFVTRPDSAPWIDSEAWWTQVEDLWRGRDVVLVRGSAKSLTAADLGAARAVTEILAPVQHAFAAYDDLLAQLRREKRRVILCLGPTATVLAWALANLGVHALDLGHIGMFRRRAGRLAKGMTADGGLTPSSSEPQASVRATQE